MKQFPSWKRWYIDRNGTEMLATHQTAYIFARHSKQYPDFAAEILNLDGLDEGAFRDDLQLAAFDAIFDKLFAEVDDILQDLLARHAPDVVGCHLNNSTWPGTLFLLRKVKELAPAVRTVVGGPGFLEHSGELFVTGRKVRSSRTAAFASAPNESNRC